MGNDKVSQRRRGRRVFDCESVCMSENEVTVCVRGRKNAREGEKVRQRERKWDRERESETGRESRK